MSEDVYGFKTAAVAFLDKLPANRALAEAALRILLSRAYFNGCEDSRQQLAAGLRGKREPVRRFMNDTADR